MAELYAVGDVEGVYIIESGAVRVGGFDDTLAAAVVGVVELGYGVIAFGGDLFDLDELIVVVPGVVEVLVADVARVLDR